MAADEGGGSDDTRDYPWYRVPADEGLEQGDLLFNFPFVSVGSSYAEISRYVQFHQAVERREINPDDIEEPFIDFNVEAQDVVVLTQSCDLAVGKTEHVVLCPFFSFPDLSFKFKDVSLKQVKRGQVESLYLLLPCQVAGLNMTDRVVNFRQVFTAPIDLVMEHAQEQAVRVRVCPPYREHLAQAFARFFMRVAFPVDPPR
jgi:hypothetical protein